MRAIIVLTLLHAFLGNAIPIHIRETCSVTLTSTSTSTNTITRTVTATATVTRTRTSSTAASATGTGVFIASLTTSGVTPSVSVTTVSTSSGTVQILPSPTKAPGTSGSVVSTLVNSGIPTSAPIISNSVAKPSSLISTAQSASTVASQTAPTPNVAGNIFQPVAVDAPPTVIGTRGDHPVARLGIQPQTMPLSTNKFYANFFLGTQTAPSFTHPYSVAWSKGGGSSESWGISISHIDADQRVYGPNPSADPVGYFINPGGIQSIVLSAVGLGSTTTISTDALTDLSVNVNLLPSPGAAPAITFPLVQGMGFVTAVYHGGTPQVQSGIFFRTLTRVVPDPKRGVSKYRIVLEDGKTWVLYAYSSDGSALTLQVVNNGLAQSTSNWNGIIQIAKVPNAATEAVYDASAGAYATAATVSATVDGAVGNYNFEFTKMGLASATLLMFGLPHHVASFAPVTASAVSTVQLQTTTKGVATAVVADSWTMTESEMPVNMGFAPWMPGTGTMATLSSTAIKAIQSVALSEVSEDMGAQTNLQSMYFSGKALAKFAGIVYVLNDLVDNPTVAQAGLTKLKAAFSVFTSNTQAFPLVRETAWGGIVSSATYTSGDAGADFGNTYYNDHHFHYGYFIYTAAIIGHLDPSWLTEGQNKAWVNALVRDTANPSSADPYFPLSRMFDWYHGHSWAHGLYETFDGKDEESSSEDTMFAYALKSWGRTIGDANLEARGNLQLAITARTLQGYFLYTDGNAIQPSNFVGNKVSGIMFENKIDHTTYFGTNIEYIQGIHMIPLLPSSALTRTKTFVQQEWSTYFDKGRVDAIESGWKGILYANLALFDPVSSWNFFSSSSFDASWLDGGASRTWYLAFAAGLGGAPS